MRDTMRLLRCARAALVAVLLAPAAAGGGPLLVRASGHPYLWPDGGRDVPYHTDRGDLGTLDAAAAVAQTDAAFASWSAVPTASLGFRNAGLLPYDVTERNFLPWIFPNVPDGLSAIVYDENGAIFDMLFGRDSGVLGFASPEWIDTETGEIVEGVAFLNGYYLLLGFPEAEMLSTQVHEFGHFANLAHSAVNFQVALFGDHTGPTPFDTFPRASLAGQIETMAPIVLVGGGQATPHPDDAAIVSTLYPEPGAAASRGAIRGTILAPNARTPLSGINVIARNVRDPFGDAVSAISGDFAVPGAPDDPLAGRYVLAGLTPGAEYAVYVDEILAGGFSTPPRSPLPAPEEFFSGAAESPEPDGDDPAVYVGVTALAGRPVDGVDVILNRRLPGPLPLHDDDSIEVWLPFDFPFCGREYGSLFVNANGTISFGEPVALFSESPSGFLAGPPQIAGLWDDLRPFRGGSISVAEQLNRYQVRWTDVPEYPATGANSFAITLHRSSGLIDLDYGALSARDGLAGYSCGAALTSRLEPQFDFTALAAGTDRTLNAHRRPAIWEWFPTGNNDLAGHRLSSTATGSFLDLDEPNDDIGAATRVELPFDSRERFSAIGPAGGDVDFYRFRGAAGAFVYLETLPGNSLDTVLGLFDAASGALLAVDDDGGVGALSRIALRLPADGVYAVAVSTYPDLEFRGAGVEAGRYVLSLEAIDGTLISLRDDDFYEYQFTGFEFPFQGRLWRRLFINSNGNITFDDASVDHTETAREFLFGPPRIAALWDDLDPTFRGRVVIKTDPGRSLAVTFRDVPEYPDLGSNTFSVTMHVTGEVSLRYGAINANDGLVGVTPGRFAADPGETDLSEAGALHVGGTAYELFGPRELDLGEMLLLFGLP